MFPLLLTSNKTASDVFFVFLENYFLGWRSWVDGKEVSIKKFRGALQAVKIKKGDHKIIFKYTSCIL